MVTRLRVPCSIGGCVDTPLVSAENFALPELKGAQVRYGGIHRSSGSLHPILQTGLRLAIDQADARPVMFVSFR